MSRRVHGEERIYSIQVEGKWNGFVENQNFNVEKKIHAVTFFLDISRKQSNLLGTGVMEAKRRKTSEVVDGVREWKRRRIISAERGRRSMRIFGDGVIRWKAFEKCSQAFDGWLSRYSLRLCVVSTPRGRRGCRSLGKNEGYWLFSIMMHRCSPRYCYCPVLVIFLQRYSIIRFPRCL